MEIFSMFWFWATAIVVAVFWVLAVFAASHRRGRLYLFLAVLASLVFLLGWVPIAKAQYTEAVLASVPAPPAPASVIQHGNVPEIVGAGVSSADFVGGASPRWRVVVSTPKPEFVEKIVEKVVEVHVPYTVTVTSPITVTVPYTVVSVPMTAAAMGQQEDLGIVKAYSSESIAPTEVLVSGWGLSWYRGPFRETTDYLRGVNGTLEIFAEPGVLLDATAAFDYLSAPETPVLVPEGGYTYMSVGSANISGLALAPQDRNIYLVILRGVPSDGTPVDLNSILPVSGYVRGAGIYSQLPVGAYVSLGWFLQQIENSKSPPNCGASGCNTATIVVVDVASKSYRMWTVADLSKPREWAVKN
ncbi:MAG: hypothetical protein ABIB98_02485 [bacterium]